MRFSYLTWSILGIVLLLLSGVVFSEYLSLDEPAILWAFRSGNGWKDYLTRCLSEGRPIYGFLSAAGLHAAGTLTDLKYLRLINVLLSFLFCLLLFRYLAKNGVGHRIAFVSAALIFCLPSFSVFMCWAETFPMHISSMLSFFAGILVVRAMSKHLGETPLSTARERMYLFAAGGIQLVSLLNYQGLALAFMLPVFMTLILKPEISARNRLFFFMYCCFVFFICLGIYYKLYQTLILQYGSPMSQRGKLGTDVIGKAKWFAYILIEASKLHLLLFKSVFVKYTFSILIGLILLRDVIKKRFLDLFLLFAVSILLFLPFLVIEESWGASRNFGLVAMAFVFYLVIRCFELIRTPSYWLTAAIVTPFVIILFANIAGAWVKPAHDDYEFIQAFSQKLPPMQGNILVAVTPPIWNMHEKHTYFKYYFDEYNHPVFTAIYTLEPAVKLFYQGKYPNFSAEDINKLLKVKKINGTEGDSLVVHQAVFRLDMNYK